MWFRMRETHKGGAKTWPRMRRPTQGTYQCLLWHHTGLISSTGCSLASAQRNVAVTAGVKDWLLSFFSHSDQEDHTCNLFFSPLLLFFKRPYWRDISNGQPVSPPSGAGRGVRREGSAGGGDTSASAWGALRGCLAPPQGYPSPPTPTSQMDRRCLLNASLLSISCQNATPSLLPRKTETAADSPHC